MRPLVCQITNAQPPQSVRNEMAFAFRTLEGKRVEITIAEHKPRRSGKQNDSLWGVIYAQIVEFYREAGRETDVDEVHEEMKAEFGLKKSVKGLDGKYRAVPISTSEYTTQEMNDYWTRMAAWCAEFDKVLLFPNEPPF